MRDPNRLDDFYDRLKTLHKEKVPDWRFGQLFNNLQTAFNSDLFYVEDDKLIEAVEKLIGEADE